MLKQIRELGSRQPQGRTREEAIAEFRDTHAQRISVAEKLLGMDTDSAARLVAAQAVLESMSILDQIGTPNVRPQQQAFSKQLAKDADSLVARLGQLMLFGILVEDFSGSGTTTVRDIVDGLEKLLGSGDQDQRSMMIAAQAASTLGQKGAQAEAQAAFELIIKTFRNHKVPELAMQSQQLELQMQLNKALKHEEGASDKFVADLEKLMTGGNAVSSLQMANDIERVLEISQERELALQVLDLMQKVVDASGDPQIADVAKVIALARRRINLVGEELVVDLPTLEEKPLDWSPYKGKVVLIDFWATWCGPCLQEFPNIRRTLETYRDQGFEVLGVSLDEDRQDLDQFFRLQKLPWTTVVNAGSAPKGQDSFATRCGVDPIPFTVLLGRDGRVAAVNLRGEALAKKVEELLAGDSKSSAEEGKATNKTEKKEAEEKDSNSDSKVEKKG